MGQAKLRGTPEERKAAAIRAKKEAEVREAENLVPARPAPRSMRSAIISAALAGNLARHAAISVGPKGIRIVRKD